MKQTTFIGIFNIIIFTLVLAHCEAEFYKDYMSINSRIPGDQEIIHSNAVQNLDFDAKVTIELRYPDKLPHSEYIVSHILLNGEDDSGYINGNFAQGGPGEDYMRMRIFFYSIRNGKFELFVYGKKK